jgi:hypothetical protein
MIYHEDDNFIVKWDIAVKCVVLERKPAPYVNRESLEAAGKRILEFIFYRKAYKLILDGREMKVTSNDDKDWLMEEFIPQLAKVGIKYRALVIPKSPLGRIAFENLKQIIPETNERKYFADLESARNWLRFL